MVCTVTKCKSKLPEQAFHLFVFMSSLKQNSQLDPKVIEPSDISLEVEMWQVHLAMDSMDSLRIC